MSQAKKLIRQKFREVVFARNNGKCAIPSCSLKADDAHHITDRNLMPNGGYVAANGIALCIRHHQDAEVYHRSEGKQWVPGFHPDDLYKIIGSSHEEAVAADLRVR